MDTVQSNVGNYFYNQKNITYANNNYLGANWTDLQVANTLLYVAFSPQTSYVSDRTLFRNLHTQGTFIAAEWSPQIFENVLSADIMSREINGLWSTTGSVHVALSLSDSILTLISANTYISYTFLDDDVNATKCLGPTPAPSSTADPGDKNGPPSTKYCADGGVYYLNKLSQTEINTASVAAPNGFDSMTNFGIYPWFATSGSARAYRALNPDSSQIPVYNTPEAEAAYNAYVANFASNRTGELMDLIGQTPGSWSLPVCDQGYNTWTYDWSDSGGLQLTDQSDLAMPCACGHQGTGTANFYKQLSFAPQTMAWIAENCAILLLNVAEGMDVTAENIGWNAIAGGAPKTIVYDESNTITAPNSLPTNVCGIAQNSNVCPNKPPDTEQQTSCEEHPNSCGGG